MKNIRQWFRNAVLVLAGVMLLAACGNSAKADLAAIAKVMVDTGYSPQKNQEYQLRLQQAKSEAESKAIVAEMLQYFEKVPAGLNALSMKTDEGRGIRDDLAQGMDKVIRATKQALTLSPKDTAAMMEAQKLALEGQQQLLQGQNKFMVAAGREGIKLENK